MANSIATTILAQLGGTGRLVTMIGAHNFIDRGKGLSLSFRGCRKANRLIITLDESDTYTVELGKFSRCSYTTVYEASGIYADGLRQVIENETGLYLSLGTLGRGAA